MDALGTEDPFVSVQREVEASWAQISTQFEQWKGQASFESPASHALREEIKNNVHTIEWDIQDLQEAVRIAKEDPVRFKLSAAQISSRERFVLEMKQKIDRVQVSLSETINVPSSSVAKEELLTGGRQAERQEETRETNNQFIDNEMMHQERILKQQDEDLDHLASAVERIGLMGNEMHQNLSEQGQLLDGLGDDMDETRSRMANVRQKLDRFIEETGPRQFCTIVGLCITFLILTFLVVTT